MEESTTISNSKGGYETDDDVDVPIPAAPSMLHGCAGSAQSSYCGVMPMIAEVESETEAKEHDDSDSEPPPLEAVPAVEKSIRSVRAGNVEVVVSGDAEASGTGTGATH